MSETQLATRDERAPITVSETGVQPRTFDELARFCLAVSKSRLAPKGLETPEAIMVAIQHGAEIGLAPMQALSSIAVINGRPSVWGDAALALVKGHADCVDVIESSEGTGEGVTAICEVKRNGKATVIRRFSVADAKKAGLWGKTGPWSQYPLRMLQLRARAFALRDSFPDVLRGIGIREEQQDVQPREVKTVKLELPPEPEDAVTGEVRDIDPKTGELL